MATSDSEPVPADTPSASEDTATPDGFGEASGDDFEDDTYDALANYRDSDDSGDNDESLSDMPDARPSYAVRFLTFVHGIPFRIAALRQELADVHGFDGQMDQAFLDRMEYMTPPERLAFQVAFEESQRLEAFENRFSQVVETDGAPADAMTAEARLQDYLAAYESALEGWHTAETGSAVLDSADGYDATPNRTRSHNSGDSSGGNKSRMIEDALAGRSASVRGAIAEAGGELGEIGGDEFATHVLNALAQAELQEAERRLTARAGWLTSLPHRQRTAFILRTAGLRRREIAARMGISEESVKTHLQRASEDWSRRQTAPASGINRHHPA